MRRKMTGNRHRKALPRFRTAKLAGKFPRISCGFSEAAFWGCPTAVFLRQNLPAARVCRVNRPNAGVASGLTRKPRRGANPAGAASIGQPRGAEAHPPGARFAKQAERGRRQRACKRAEARSRFCRRGINGTAARHICSPSADFSGQAAQRFIYRPRRTRNTCRPAPDTLSR